MCHTEASIKSTCDIYIRMNTQFLEAFNPIEKKANDAYLRIFTLGLFRKYIYRYVDTAFMQPV